jgi:hypothetical protein
MSLKSACIVIELFSVKDCGGYGGDNSYVIGTCSFLVRICIHPCVCVSVTLKMASSASYVLSEFEHDPGGCVDGIVGDG